MPATQRMRVPVRRRVIAVAMTAILTALLAPSAPAAAHVVDPTEGNGFSVPVALAPADGQKIGGSTWPLSGTIIGPAGTRTLSGRFDLHDVTAGDRVVVNDAAGRTSV